MKTRTIPALALLALPLLLVLAGCRATRSGGPEAAGRAAAEEPRPVRVLFLGHRSEHHNSAAFFPMLAVPLARRGIQLTYVDDPAEALDPDRLKHYDALALYANHDEITPEQERALLDFVASGGGFVPIHSASYSFRNSDAYVRLVGAQFASHGTDTFTVRMVRGDHPAVEGVAPFATWDETYVHHRLDPDRIVLMERVAEGVREPYTWVRTHGEGRVFYTALGHDERTWSQPGFHRLVEQGILWAVGDDVRARWERLRPPELVYTDAKLPNYERRDPPPKYQHPLTAQESQKLVHVPADFRLELFAAEPMVVNPITMAFDERGRLWVVETTDYPNETSGGEAGDDRIKILEDTDGDGRADRATVFADSLNIPTSLVFVDDGVLVAQAPDFLFLKDTDGDDRADVREKRITGWQTWDTHAGPSNLQYAPDNRIWGTVGYAGFEGKVDGDSLRFRQAAYRFRPDGSGLEVLTGTTNNTWGLGFSETFDVFGSTANNDPSWYLAIPDRLFEGAEGLPRRSGYQSIGTFYGVHPLTPYIRQVDVHGGFTAAAGHQLYTARAFPERYWNRIAFINEPTAHLVAQVVLEKQGAGFAARDARNLLAGAEEWVAPVHAQVGPDGAVWVLDWYDFIVQHNPTPQGFSNGPGNAYVTDLRDHARGRIYRVVHRDAPAYTPVRLRKDDPDGLVHALASDNLLWRLHAQRMLVERGERDVLPALYALVRDEGTDAVGLNGGALHALWTLHGLGALDGSNAEALAAATRALRHPAAGVRKAAAMTLPPGAAAGRALLDAQLLADPDLHTRLAAVVALAEQPASEEIGRALHAASLDASNYGDPWLGRALYLAAVRHRDGFLAARAADPGRLPVEALPAWLRLGDVRPDWRQPAAGELGYWQPMEVPGRWEERGLADFDGIVWFTRTFDWDGGAAADTLHLGPIGQRDETWINGVPVGRGQRGSERRAYPVPAGVLQPGANVLTVRVENFRQEGGFTGAASDVYLAAGSRRLPLAGPWRYRVERQTNMAALYRRPGELGAHVARYYGEGVEAPGADLAGLEPAPDVILTLGVVEHQMKFDREELTVPAGRRVEIVFRNPDLMQHNVVVTAPGALEKVGEAADRLARLPDGAAQQYVPAVPEVLFATPLVGPGESFRLRFTAPETPGRYPFVCTFPGHWRLMNGVLIVR